MAERNECACDYCKGMCQSIPGWFTPAEADSFMDEHDPVDLMLDWWESDDDLPGGALVLCPATYGNRGELAPVVRGWFGRRDPWPCILQDECGMCTIHTMKPFECAVASCAPEELAKDGPRLDLARMWATESGRRVVMRWRSITGCSDHPDNVKRCD